jgi:hypothetical protein
MTHSCALLIILNEDDMLVVGKLCVVMNNDQKSEHHNPLDYWCEQGVYQRMFLLCLYLCHSLCHWNRISKEYKGKVREQGMVPSGNTVPYILLSANLFLILLHVYILNRIESKLVSLYIYIYTIHFKQWF